MFIVSKQLSWDPRRFSPAGTLSQGIRLLLGERHKVGGRNRKAFKITGRSRGRETANCLNPNVCSAQNRSINPLDPWNQWIGVVTPGRVPLSGADAAEHNSKLVKCREVRLPAPRNQTFRRGFLL